MQISEYDFSGEFFRMYRALSRVQSETDGFMSALKEKARTYHERWTVNFPDTSFDILRRMVDKAIDNGKDFPPFSEFKLLRQSVMTELPKHLKTYHNCGFCDRGYVSAWRVEDGLGPRQTNFRCPQCDEWKAPCVAVWSDSAITQGYTLGRMPRNSDATAKAYIPKTVPGYDDKAKFEEARKASLRMDAIRAQGRQGESFQESWWE